MNHSNASNGMPLKRMFTALTCVGLAATFSGCGGGGGGGGSAPPTPTVSIDLFGARGSLLTAIVSSTNCSGTPTVTWQSSSGAALGTGTTIQDTQANSTVIATASCLATTAICQIETPGCSSTAATASKTLAANSVYSGLAAFAVLQNGTAVAWGNPVWGGQTEIAATITGISQLFPSDRGFAALLNNNTIKGWGSSYVAVADPTLVYPATGAIATSALTDIVSVIPGRVAYFGTKKDGSFVAWGSFRGILSGVDSLLADPVQGLSPAMLAALTNVKSIASTEGAYAALKSDGSVVTFGDPDSGGDSSKVKAALTNVTQIVGANFDFVALRKDGTVVNWGLGYASPTGDAGVIQTLSDVANLTLNGYAGVATTSKGVASAFGYAPQIEAADSSLLASSLMNVTNVYATHTAFAALRADGTLISWGDQPRMATSLTAVQSALVNVKTVQSTEYAFAALKGDGTVVSWGDPEVGGDSSAVVTQLNKVVALTANKYAFAALKSDGTVVTWGMGSKGGDSSAVASKLTNVRAIYATALGAFLAVNKDGSFVTWGDPWSGGGAVPATLTKIPYTS